MTATDTLRRGGELVVAVVLWPFKQAAAWARNLWDVVGRVTLDEVLIPSLYGLYTFTKRQLPWAFGLDTPEHQLTGSFVLAVLAFFTGFISGFVTWIFVALFAVTFLVGLLRLFPAVERRWPL